MATYLLDSSVIIDALNGKHNRDQLFKALLERGHLLACCPINVTEVYAGLRSHEETRTRELLEELAVLSDRVASCPFGGPAEM